MNTCHVNERWEGGKTELSLSQLLTPIFISQHRLWLAGHRSDYLFLRSARLPFHCPHLAGPFKRE